MFTRFLSAAVVVCVVLGLGIQGLGIGTIQLTQSPFVGGNNPTTVAGATPKPNAPVLDAGSGDGTSPDYISDIGAIELGAITDTSVPAGGWELYR